MTVHAGWCGYSASSGWGHVGGQVQFLAQLYPCSSSYSGSRGSRIKAWGDPIKKVGVLYVKEARLAYNSIIQGLVLQSFHFDLQQEWLYILLVVSRRGIKRSTRRWRCSKIHSFYCFIKDILKWAWICLFVCLVVGIVVNSIWRWRMQWLLV